MWASEKGWLLPNDAGSRSTCGTVQVAKWANPPLPPVAQRDWGMEPLENKEPHLDGSTVDAR